MSLVDKYARLAADQAITVSAVCTDTYPLGVAGQDIGSGPIPLGIRFTVKVAALVVGTETYEFQIVSATASNGTSGSDVLVTTGTLTTAQAAVLLAAGDVITLAIPPGRIQPTATHITGKLVTANSAGITIDADLCAVNEQQRYHAYAAAVTAI